MSFNKIDLFILINRIFFQAMQLNIQLLKILWKNMEFIEKKEYIVKPFEFNLSRQGFH